MIVKIIYILSLILTATNGILYLETRKTLFLGLEVGFLSIAFVLKGVI